MSFTSTKTSMEWGPDPRIKSVSGLRTLPDSQEHLLKANGRLPFRLGGGTIHLAIIDEKTGSPDRRRGPFISLRKYR